MVDSYLSLCKMENLIIWTGISVLCYTIGFSAIIIMSVVVPFRENSLFGEVN